MTPPPTYVEGPRRELLGGHRFGNAPKLPAELIAIIRELELGR